MSLAGSRMPDDTPGHPWLPARFINVLVPSGARVDAVQAQADEVLVAKDVLIYPVQPPFADGWRPALARLRGAGPGGLRDHR